MLVSRGHLKLPPEKGRPPPRRVLSLPFSAWPSPTSESETSVYTFQVTWCPHQIHSQPGGKKPDPLMWSSRSRSLAERFQPNNYGAEKTLSPGVQESCQPGWDHGQTLPVSAPQFPTCKMGQTRQTHSLSSATLETRTLLINWQRYLTWIATGYG